MSTTKLKQRLSEIPTNPGVYLYRDEAGTVLYVGKAKNLRARVRSYFADDLPIKTRVLMDRAADLDWLVTGNEYEALLLENNLIKEHAPRYNINLKDGKSYPVIRVTNDEYPRVFKTRRLVQDGSRYFGPFVQVGTIDTYLDLIQRLYPLRRCRTPKLKKRKEPCLYWHIGRCAAVCAGKTSHDEYTNRVDATVKLLSGDTGPLRHDLRTQMHEAAAGRRYERAAEFRDSLKAIDTIESEQRIVDFDPEIRDYIGFASREQLYTFTIFQMRAGRMVGSTLFHAELAGDDAENLAEFMVQFYGSTGTPPRRLYVSDAIGDIGPLERYFREHFDATVSILPPQTARDGSILRLCTENARQELERRMRERGDRAALESLEEILDLPHTPLRIEGFDIAHVGGRNTVAAMVSFANGVPDKGEYKRFRIRTLAEGKVDDFASMREVIARRYTRVKNEQMPRPDLILIDGGRGQVSAAVGVLTALDLDIPVVGIAKREEELFLPDRVDPILLPEGTPALRVLQHVRDEAHRFATTYRAGLQKRDIVTSALEGIRGIGKVRAARILRAFPTAESLVETPIDIVAKSTGLSEELALRVREAVQAEIDR